MIAAAALAVALIGVPAQEVPPPAAPAAAPDCGADTLTPCWNLPALDDWAYDALAWCETGRRPDARPTRRWRYEGAFSFLPSTWRAFAPAGFPAHAYDATYEEQRWVARLVVQGGGGFRRQFPGCARRIGL